jgi:hypothetical protein
LRLPLGYHQTRFVLVPNVVTLSFCFEWKLAKSGIAIATYGGDVQSMAKRKRRLPHGQLGKPIVLANEDWREIADAAKIKLTTPILMRLDLSTIFLGALGQLERSAPSKAVLSKIRKLEKLISAMRHDFPNVSDQASELFFSQLAEIQQYATRTEEQFQQIGLMFLLELFSHVLMLNQKLLRAILKYAVVPDSYKYIEGNVWDLWIILLTTILKNAGLPTEVRKDQENTSKFVIFVREIQARLPSHLYKKRSDDALAKAITRARGNFGSLITAKADFLLCLFLGALKPGCVKPRL